jgi:hypothetical protein
MKITGTTVIHSLARRQFQRRRDDGTLWLW